MMGCLWDGMSSKYTKVISRALIAYGEALSQYQGLSLELYS